MTVIIEGYARKEYVTVIRGMVVIPVKGERVLTIVVMEMEYAKKENVSV